MLSPILPVIALIIFILILVVLVVWVILEFTRSIARKYLIDHFDSINQKLKPYGFFLEYQVSEAYDEQVVHLFRLLDTRTGISSPWASPSVAFSWVNRLKNESIEQVFSDALRYDIHKISKRKPLPFDISSKRSKK